MEAYRKKRARKVVGVEDVRCEVAEFVRGFFLELDRSGCDTAVLHGWENSFEEELSDVDFVVDRRTFAGLAGIIHGYCQGVGWCLMQVLKHESTGYFFVCSRAGNPECVVALDACSDYQRKGIHFLSAEELLDGKLLLPWGGFRLKEEIELKYRLVKAAAKQKKLGEVYSEYETYSTENRKRAIAWACNRWGMAMGSEDRNSFDLLYGKLVSKFLTPSILARIRSTPRYLGRIIKPTGALVETSPELSNEELKCFMGKYSCNYFRATEHVKDFAVMDCKRIIKTTLMCHRGKTRWWQRMFLRGCYFDGSECGGVDDLVDGFGLWLDERVRRREELE